MNIHTGVYEQIINHLFKLKLNEVDTGRFYIGKKLHGVYSKAQIQAALGFSTLERKSSSREGVERLKGIKLEAMYVDIIKKREEGSKPMQIVWHLNTPMSEATYAFASQYKAIG